MLDGVNHKILGRDVFPRKLNTSHGKIYISTCGKNNKHKHWTLDCDIRNGEYVNKILVLLRF